MVKIRPMNLTDIAELQRWVPQLPLWQSYGLTEEGLKRQLESALAAHELTGVAQNKEGICGFFWCQPKAAFGRSAYLKLIGVKENHQGQGVGDALLTALEEQLKPVTKDLFLLVSDFNETAQRFYLRHGFTKIGSISAYVLPDVDEFIFRKTLI